MLLLAVDSSGKDGSIVLADGNPDGTCSLIETLRLDGGAFSAQLVPCIASLLSKHEFGKADLGGFVVVSGPGSFTGLRVGLAAVKALAEVLLKPIAAVSLLEALAIASGETGRVFAALNAGRQQTYLGEYELTLDSTRRIDERLISQQEFAASVRASKVVTSDPALALLAESAGTRAHLNSVSLDFIAALGWKRILAGDTVLPENLEANYITRPNAEILLSRQP